MPANREASRAADELDLIGMQQKIIHGLQHLLEQATTALRAVHDGKPGATRAVEDALYDEGSYARLILGSVFLPGPRPADGPVDSDPRIGSGPDLK